MRVLRKNYGDISYEVDKEIAILTINRPQKLNSLTEAGFSNLYRAVTEADSDNEIKVIILTGAGGRAFSTGYDMTGISDLTIASSRLLHSENAKLSRAMLKLSKVSIAAINGMALGAGFELSLLCDITVASETATFGLPETAIGVYPGCVAPAMLCQLVGVKKAKELLFTGNRMSAAEAVGLGLVNKIVGSDKVMDTATELAKKIINAAPLPITMVKARMNSMLQSLLEEEIAYFIEIQTLLFISKDFKEGLSAFKEKRKPTFTGE